jgi:hypothetical protein
MTTRHRRSSNGGESLPLRQPFWTAQKSFRNRHFSNRRILCGGAPRWSTLHLLVPRSDAILDSKVEAIEGDGACAQRPRRRCAVAARGERLQGRLDHPVHEAAPAVAALAHLSVGTVLHVVLRTSGASGGGLSSVPPPAPRSECGAAAGRPRPSPIRPRQVGAGGRGRALTDESLRIEFLENRILEDESLRLSP